MIEVVADHSHYWFTMKLSSTVSVSAFNWSAQSFPICSKLFNFVAAVVDRKLYLMFHRRPKSYHFHSFSTPSPDVFTVYHHSRWSKSLSSVSSVPQVSSLPQCRLLRSPASRQILHRWLGVVITNISEPFIWTWPRFRRWNTPHNTLYAWLSTIFALSLSEVGRS